MRNAPKYLFLLLLVFGHAAFAGTIITSGYLDPNAADPSLPAWAQRVGFDLGPPQVFPSETTNVVLADFNLNPAGPLLIESFGYAVTGTGIDPYITLFSGSTSNPSAATFVLEHSPGGDFVLPTAPLTAGSYVLAISAWDNYGCPFGTAGCTLADGFSGLANLPFGHDTFFDIHITGDVSPGAATPIPEPGMVVPLAAGLAIVLYRQSRRRKTC